MNELFFCPHCLKLWLKELIIKDEYYYKCPECNLILMNRKFDVVGGNTFVGNNRISK